MKKIKQLMNSASLGMAVVVTALLIPAKGFGGQNTDTLRAALQLDIANLDAYYDSAGSVVVMNRHIWDTLYFIDPTNNELVPALASGSSFLDDKTLDVTLRRGVKFHDGSDMDANDVAYTLNWIKDPANKIKSVSKATWIEKVDILDTHKVRIHMKKPNALALRFLSLFPIHPEGIYEKHGVAAMNIEPIGTGPYRVKSMDLGKKYVLERFDDHYSESPKGRAKIANLEVSIIPEPATQIAEIMSGNLDWIYKVAADQATELSSVKSLEVESKPTSRTMYIVLDAAGRTGPDSPFKSLKVRQAVAHAIDRQGIVKALVKGGAQVLDAFCFSQDFGCPKDNLKQYSYDPEKARQLLTEAGYPDGFEVTFSAWRDRPYVEAIMSNLADVGIKVKLNYIKLTPLRKQWENGELPMVYGSIGSRVSDIGNFVPTFFGKSKRNIAGDEEVSSLLIQAGESMDEETRRQLSYQALRRVSEQALAVPMFSDNMNFVHSSKVVVPSDSGGTPHFYLAEWK